MLRTRAGTGAGGAGARAGAGEGAAVAGSTVVAGSNEGVAIDRTGTASGARAASGTAEGCDGRIRKSRRGPTTLRTGISSIPANTAVHTVCRVAGCLTLNSQSAVALIPTRSDGPTREDF